MLTKLVEVLGRAINMPATNSHTGMSITPRHIRIIDVVKHKRADGGLSLNCFQEISLINENPFHPDNVALVNEVISKNHLRARTVNVLAIDKSLIVRRVETHAVPRDEMIESLRFVEQEQVPYPMQNAALDVMPFPTSKEEGQIPAIMAVLDGDVVKSYNDFIKLTGFKHVAISIRPTAISARLEHAKTFDREDGVPIISIGRDITGIQFYQDAQLKFQRDVPIGDANVFAVAAGTYEVDGKPVSITAEDVGRLRLQFGVPRGDDLVRQGAKGVTGQMFLDKLQPGLDKMATEISRSIDFFKSNQQIFRIPNAYLIGEAALIPNLAEYLTDEIGISFLPYDPFRDFIEGGLDKMGDKRGLGPQYAALLGAALDDGSKINLLPPRMRYQFSDIIPRLAALAVAALFVIFVFGVNIGTMAYRNTAAKTQEELRIKVVEIGAVDIKLAALNKVVEEFKARPASHPRVVGGDVKWRNLFSATESAMPDDAALDGILIKFGGEREYAGDGQRYSREVIFNGRVRGIPGNQVEVLQKLAQNMTDSGAFRHMTILSAQREPEKTAVGAEQLLFTMAADISRGAGTK